MERSSRSYELGIEGEVAAELAEMLMLHTSMEGRFMAEFTRQEQRILLYPHNPEFMNGLLGTIHIAGPSVTAAGQEEAKSGPLIYHLWATDLPTWNTKEQLRTIDRTKLTARQEEALDITDLLHLREVLATMKPAEK